jgi:phosphatidylglycerophosphatase A
MKYSYCKSVATLGPLGYLAASGTVGSLVAVPLALFLNTFLSRETYAILLVLCAAVAWLIIQASCQLYTEHDPREIILDEVIGCLIALYALPLNPGLLLLAFLFFRLVDITKLGGIHYLEKLPGATGILLDDIAAGIYVNCGMQLWLFWNS